MSDQFILESVGSYLESNGTVGPLEEGGLPDLSPGVQNHVSEVDAEWMQKLSPEDKKVVEHVKAHLPNRFEVKVKYIEREPTLPDRPGEMSFSDCQFYVGGLVERVKLGPNRYMYVNEEGYIHQLPHNPEASRIAGKPILGNVVICGKFPEGGISFGGGYVKDETAEFNHAANEATYSYPMTVAAEEKQQSEDERYLAEMVQVTDFNKYFDDEPWGPKG